MWKPSEATDDFCVLLGIFREFVVAVAARHIKAAFLIGEIFRMHERQIEKRALGSRYLQIETPPDGTIGHRPRAFVAGVTAGIAPEHVTRKLIERDDEGERAFRRFLPSGQTILSARLPKLQEAIGNFGIEGRIVGEPFVRSGGRARMRARMRDQWSRLQRGRHGSVTAESARR